MSDNFIMARKDFVEGLSDEEKIRWEVLKTNAKLFGISIMIGKRRIPGELEGSFHEAIAFIFSKGAVRLIESYAPSPTSALESMEKFLDVHEVEVY